MSNAAELILEPQPHGGALQRSGGRPPGQVREAMRLISREAKRSVDLLVALRDDPKLDPEVRIKAACELLKLTAIARRRPAKQARSTFNVRTTGAARELERAADAEDASDAGTAADNAPAQTDSGAGAPP